MTEVNALAGLDQMTRDLDREWACGAPSHYRVRTMRLHAAYFAHIVRDTLLHGQFTVRLQLAQPVKRLRFSQRLRECLVEQVRVNHEDRRPISLRLHRNQRADVGMVAQPLRKTSGRGGIEDGGDRQTRAEAFVQSSEEAHQQERVTACFEEG